MKITYALVVSAMIAGSFAFSGLGSEASRVIAAQADSSSMLDHGSGTPALASRSDAAQGALLRGAARAGKLATAPIRWVGRRTVQSAAQLTGAALLPVIVRHPELSRMPGLRWSATAANVLDLSANAGPLSTYRKLRPYSKQLTAETPMWRAYYVSVRWLRRHLGIAQWEPPSRAPRFEELSYLRNKPTVEPRLGRGKGLHWGSPPPAGTARVELGSVLGEGFANRVWKAELNGHPVAVKSRKSQMGWWLGLRTRDQRLPHELDGAANLHEYLGGPDTQLVSFDHNGERRLGLAMDLVEGRPLSQWNLADDSPEFAVSRAHLESIEKIFDRLDQQGLWLEDLHDGQLMLRADGSVTPIDMRVEPLGNGNPMVLEYARRRAGVLDMVADLTKAGR